MTDSVTHGIMDTTTWAIKPTLSSPVNMITGLTTSPILQWNPVQNALMYHVQVAKDSLFTLIVRDNPSHSETWLQLNNLDSLQTYFWRVASEYVSGTSPWSDVWSFTTSYGTTFTNTVQNRWNLLSLPITVLNPLMIAQFPTATSHAFEFNPANGYTACDTMDVGDGYWIKFGAQGSFYQTGVSVASRTIPVVEGWNLIGSISSSVPVSSITSTPGGIVTSEFFGYSN